MKLLTLLLLLIPYSFVSAQSSELVSDATFLSDQLSIHFEGTLFDEVYIESQDGYNELYGYIININRYWSYSLVRMRLTSFVDKYNDIAQIIPWREVGYRYGTSLSYKDYMVLIYYDNGRNKRLWILLQRATI